MEVATLGLKVDGSPVDKASTSLDRFTKSADNAEHAATDMGRGVDRAGKQAQDRLKKVDDRARALGNRFKLVAAAAVSALGGIGVGRLVSETASFEQSLLGLQVVSGATAAQMKELEDQSRLLGATSMFSAQQAADAQNFLAMAGFEVNEVLGATPGLLELAAAGSMDLASAADLASNVLGGFRLEVEELARVNDVLAATAAGSNTNIQQLGQALSFAAPIAAGAGVSIEETAAAIGVLSDSGLQASRAGTGLLGVIRQLSNLTPNAKAALADYGLTAEQVNIETEGLSTVLERLSEAGISASDSFTIFGSEAGPAAQILAAGAVRVNEFTGELELAEGTARRAALILGSGLTGSFRSLGSAIGESTLQLGRDSGLSAVLQDVIDSATGVISVYNGMLPEFAEANDLTDEQAGNLQTVAGALSAAAGAAGALGIAYTGTTVAVWAFHAAQRALNIAVRANPYVIAASALVAMTGALYNARNATVTLADTTVRVKDWIQAAWIEANATLIRSTGAAIDSATGFFGTFGESVGSVTNYLWETFQALMGNIADVVQWGVNRVIGYFVGLPQIAAEVARGILAQFEIAFTNIGEFAAAIPEAISSMSTDPFKRVATSAAEGFKSSCSNSVSGIAGIVEESISRDYLGEASDAISESFASFGERVSDTAFRLRFLNNQTEEAAKGLGGLGGSSNDVEVDVNDLGNTVDALGEATKKAQSEAEKFESSLQSLMDTLFPLQANLREYQEDQALLNQAYDQGLISLDQYTEGLKRLHEQRLLSQDRPDQAYDILAGPTGMGQGEDEEQGGWDKWLESAQTAFTDFDSMAASTAENFQRGFGDAFESMIFDSQSFRESMFNLFDGIARSLVIALGEMAAQWVAYQAVQATLGQTAQAASAASAAATGTAIAAAYAPAAAMASLASFGANAAPAAAGIASTTALSQSLASAGSFAGLFDNGGNIPAGQWGIAGERGPEIIQGPANVTSRRDTAAMLRGGGDSAPSAAPVINVTNNGEPKQATARSRMEDGKMIIDILLEDLAGDGRYITGLRKSTNVQRRGR